MNCVCTKGVFIQISTFWKDCKNICIAIHENWFAFRKHFTRMLLIRGWIESLNHKVISDRDNVSSNNLNIHIKCNLFFVQQVSYSNSTFCRVLVNIFSAADLHNDSYKWNHEKFKTEKMELKISFFWGSGCHISRTRKQSLRSLLHNWSASYTWQLSQLRNG